MKDNPIIIEQEMNAPIEKVWYALTNKEAISEWFFEVDDFEPEVGYEFVFYTGGEEQKYKHICKVLEVKKYQKLSYSWQYEDVSGYSVVSFHLSNMGNNTLLKFKHEGIECFPQQNPLFMRKSFVDGWNEVICDQLKEYVETD